MNDIDYIRKCMVKYFNDSGIDNPEDKVRQMTDKEVVDLYDFEVYFEENGM